MKPLPRIAIALAGRRQPQHVHDLVGQLVAWGGAELVLIELRDTGGAARQGGLAFSAWCGIERRLLAALVPRLHDSLRLADLDPRHFVANTGLTAVLQSAVRPDLIIVPSSDPGLSAALAGHARLGVLTISDFDGTGIHPELSVFNAVSRQKPAAGYAIRLLDPKRGPDRILHRGAVMTRRSFTETAAHLARESGVLLARTAMSLFTGENGAEEERRETAPASPPAAAPSPVKTAALAAATLSRLGRRLFERRVLKRDLRWGIAYARSFWQDADLSKGVRIANPPHRFLADPFVIARDGRHWIFAEDYDERRGHGAISCIAVAADGALETFDNVIEEPFHLSFPFLLEDDGELFMLPETAESRTIRLYRCTGFPDRWQPDAVLMRGVSAVDTMLVRRNGIWFMLTNLSPGATGDHASQLHLFWSSNLRSEHWQPVSLLPLVNDPAMGRNAGLLQSRDGEVYRVRQRQAFDLYGAGFSIAKITGLSKNGYAEREVASFGPDFFPHLVGTHHMHGTDDFTVYDYQTRERYV